jgi:ABC-type molybdate transport system permease subunit
MRSEARARRTSRTVALNREGFQSNNRRQTPLQILVPLMRSAFSAASALMFLLLSHEFAASLLVRSVNTQVMGTVLYDELTFGSYTAVAVMAIVMTVVAAVGLGCAFLLGSWRLEEALTWPQVASRPLALPRRIRQSEGGR